MTDISSSRPGTPALPALYRSEYLDRRQAQAGGQACRPDGGRWRTGGQARLKAEIYPGVFQQFL
jgi:hypothetical protein